MILNLSNYKIIGFLLAVLLLCCEGCKKKENDWTTTVQGTYTGTGSNNLTGSFTATTTITRVSDTKINLQLTYDGQTYCMDSVTLISASSFTINEQDGCLAQPRSGNGTFSGNNINYTMCCYAGTYQVTVVASK